MVRVESFDCSIKRYPPSPIACTENYGGTKPYQKANQHQSRPLSGIVKMTRVVFSVPPVC